MGNLLQIISNRFKGKKAELSPDLLQISEERGDGGAVFFSEGTEEDYREYEEEQQGWKGWMNRMGIR